MGHHELCLIPSISCRVSSSRTAAGTTGSFPFCSRELKRFVKFNTPPEAFLYSCYALNQLIGFSSHTNIYQFSFCLQTKPRFSRRVVFSFSELRSHLAAEHLHLQLAEGPGRYSPPVNACGEIQTSSDRPSADDRLNSPRLEQVGRLRSHTNTPFLKYAYSTFGTGTHMNQDYLFFDFLGIKNAV